jgi:hypothetical protein
VVKLGGKMQLKVKKCMKTRLPATASLYKSGQAFRDPEGCGSQISRQSAHAGDKVASPTHRPPLSSGIIPGTNFC